MRDSQYPDQELFASTLAILEKLDANVPRETMTGKLFRDAGKQKQLISFMRATWGNEK